MSGDQSPLAATTVGELAKFHVQQIRQIQGRGPYHLAGWSLGGQIAHEIAVQLRRAGETVAVLAMFDSIVLPEHLPAPDLPTMRDLVTHLLGDEPENASEAPDVSAEQAAQLLSELGPNLGSGLTPTQLDELHRGYVRGVQMSHACRPGVFDGDLLYFSATRGITAVLDAEVWRPYVSGALIQYPIEAAHAQMTNPAALASIGPILAAHLAESDAVKGGL